jgi:uncharacterized protein YciI
MTHYVVGLLRRVPHRPAISAPEADRIQEEHLATIRRLREAGELITAGPFEEDGDLRGILIFSTASVERARELTRSDPAIAGGHLALELLTWFAPAGLGVGSGASGPAD